MCSLDVIAGTAYTLNKKETRFAICVWHGDLILDAGFFWRSVKVKRMGQKVVELEDVK